MRQKSLETSAGHEEECTNCPPCSPATNLAFYWEQLELVQQALDLAN